MVKLAGLNWTFPNLVRLEISQYFMCNDGVVFGMSRSCNSLEKLVLAGCHSICTDGIFLLIFYEIICFYYLLLTLKCS